MSPARVVVAGGVNVDVIAAAAGALVPRASNPGRVRISAGGAGRNVAENLARFGISVRLLAAVDAHPLAELAVAQTAAAGVDVSGLIRVPDRGSYYVAIAVGEAVEWAVSDMAAVEALTPGHLDGEASALREAALVAVDANLSPAAIARAADLTAGALCVLPVSPAKALRVRAVLPRAALVVLGAGEAAVLTGMKVETPDDALRAGAALRAAPRGTVVLTMGGRGLAWVADERFWIDALPARVTDPSGAGDAVAAVAIYTFLTGLAPRNAATLAAAAGALTVSVEGATHPGLTLEALHGLTGRPT